MAHALRFLFLLSAVLLLSAVINALPFRVVSSDETRVVHLESTLSDATTGFDFCLKDPTNGAVLRFNATTGAYVVCGTDGTFEQGVGTITKNGTVVTLSHVFQNPAFNGLESVHASVDTSSGQGAAYLNASSESNSSFKPVSINDPNVNDNGDCSSCPELTAINEGTVNLTGTVTNAFAPSTTLTQYDVVQKLSLNSDFGGRLSRLVGGFSRNGAGSMSFNFVVRSDDGGQPGSSIYVGPLQTYTSFAAFPTVGIVHLDNLNLSTGPTFWAGFRFNPVESPLYVPYDSATTSPDTDVYGCGGSGPCQRITLNPAIRNLLLSADFEYPGLYRTGGLVRYTVPGTTDIISDKCDGYYEQINLGSGGLTQLYAENGAPTSTIPIEYTNAFARVRPILDITGTGLDGKADARYGTSGRFTAFSFIGNNDWNFCTRLSTTTDYECHTIPSYTPGTGGYTRITGVQNGFEASYGNSVADQINRVFLQYNGSAWTSAPLNPVTSSPSIGNPEFGFNWYAAKSFKLGVAYEYKLTSGAIETQLLNGNSVLGKWHVDSDDPPSSFSSSFASRMAGDCTRNGWCAFGRFDLHTKSNVADLIDYSQSPPEIKSIILGSSPQGFGFGRSVNIDGRGQNALYGSFGSSSISNQYRLQLDYLNLKTYTKFSLGYDDAAGTGTFPLSISRERASYGIGQPLGVNTIYSLTDNCLPARVPRACGTSTGTVATDEPMVPCANIAPIGGRATSPTATTVSIAVTGGSTLSIGQTSQLTATATLTNGTTKNVTTSATWHSSNPSAATVSSTGVVTGVAVGTSMIMATYQGKSGSMNVAVGGTSSPFGNLAGTWSGTWTDTRYSVSGSLSATFTVSGSTVNATGVIGLQSLGLGNESGTGAGTISGNTLNFTFSSSTVGSGSGTLSASGSGSGTGSVTGSLNLGAFDFSGTVTGNTINGMFDFTSPTGGHGVASLSKH